MNSDIIKPSVRLTPSQEYERYRQHQFEAALRYQDFIDERLARSGIILQQIVSREGQYFGENRLGLEIKFDQQMWETNRIYIEYAEKARPRDGKYAPSGIRRNDNAWLYGIGNYTMFYVFLKSYLRNCLHELRVGEVPILRHENRHVKEWQAFCYLKEIKSGTSRGFVIPCELAEKQAALVYRFEKDKTYRIVAGYKEDIFRSDVYIIDPQPLLFTE